MKSEDRTQEHRVIRISGQKTNAEPVGVRTIVKSGSEGKPEGRTRIPPHDLFIEHSSLFYSKLLLEGFALLYGFPSIISNTF